VYFKDGRYRYLDPANKWHTLGKEWGREARAEFDRLSRGTAPPQTVSALLDAFLKHRESQVRAKEVAMRTLDDNEQEAKTLRMVFGQMPVSAVKRQHVARYLRERTGKDGKPAPVRANREAALLSSAFSWAMGLRDWDINENPCYGVRRNTERPRRRYIETSELARWKQTAPARLRAFVLLKRLTGSRQGELLALTRGSITDRGLQIGISKTGRTKVVRWSWALRVTIKAILSLDQNAKTEEEKQEEKVVPFVDPATKPLFPSRYRDALTSRGFKSAWIRAMRPYLAAGGAPFRENDIRAKTASDMSTAAAQELLDHASPAITRRTYQRAPVKVRPLR
jgi:integrase